MRQEAMLMRYLNVTQTEVSETCQASAYMRRLKACKAL